jgi:hypothetical protein
VRQENAALAERVEDLETQLIELSQLRKALSAKSARASRKRKSAADGDFVNEQQKKRAVAEAVSFLRKVADTDLKMEGVIDGVRKDCRIDVDDGIDAEMVEAKVLIADELIAHLDLFCAVLTGLSLDSGIVGKLRMHYNYLLGMATPAAPLSKVGAGLLLPAHRGYKEGVRFKVKLSQLAEELQHSSGDSTNAAIEALTYHMRLSTRCTRADKLGEEAIRHIEEAILAE